MSSSNEEVENCQLLGTAHGKSQNEALQNLLSENPWIEERGFTPNGVFARQLLPEEAKHNITVLLDYLWHDEERHYEESECPPDHIFLVMKKLKSML